MTEARGSRNDQQTRAFEGRTAVVTGAGTGVGAALAIALGGAGATVNFIGRRPDRLQSVADRIHGAGGLAVCRPGDLSTMDGQVNLAHRLRESFQPRRPGSECRDVLLRSIADTDPLEFDKLYQTNIRAPYFLARTLLPMWQLRHGQVVFINSSSGITAKLQRPI